MTDATNRNPIECRRCGHKPTLHWVQHVGFDSDGQFHNDEELHPLPTTNLTDMQWVGEEPIVDPDTLFAYRCMCDNGYHGSPEDALQAWHQSGPGASQEWWQKFLRLVGEVQSDGPDAYENLVKHVGHRIACNQPEFRNSSPGWPQDEPEFGPIGYISESAKHMLQQGTKAFIRPQRDSLAKLPVYVGKPDVS